MEAVDKTWGCDVSDMGTTCDYLSHMFAFTWYPHSCLTWYPHIWLSYDYHANYVWLPCDYHMKCVPTCWLTWCPHIWLSCELRVIIMWLSYDVCPTCCLIWYPHSLPHLIPSHMISMWTTCDYHVIIIWRVTHMFASPDTLTVASTQGWGSLSWSYKSWHAPPNSLVPVLVWWRSPSPVCVYPHIPQRVVVWIWTIWGFSSSWFCAHFKLKSMSQSKMGLFEISLREGLIDRWTPTWTPNGK